MTSAEVIMTAMSVRMPNEPPVLPHDDRMLGARFSHGDDRAFDEIVRRFSPEVIRLARRLLGWRNDSDAQDIAQEVFVQAYLKRKSFRGESSLRSWLTRITLNRAHTFHRRRLTGLNVISRLLHRRKQHKSSPLESLVQDETASCVRDAVSRLGSADRELIVLHYLEQTPLNDIARLLGQTENALAVRLHRARKRLHDLLSPHGADHHE